MRTMTSTAIVIVGLATLAGAQVPRVKHVFVVVEENQDFSIVIGNQSAMPFVNELASKYAVAASYYAAAHPSIGNYFMLTTGTAIGKELKILGDERVEPVTADNVVRALRSGNETWRSYAEGVPSSGYTGGNIKDAHYVKRHNPLAYFENDTGPDRSTSLLPFSQFAADLTSGAFASYSFIVPNLFHDAHDVEGPDGSDRGKAGCGDSRALRQADDWLRTNIGPLIASPTFQEHGLLVIVFDEACDDDESDGGGHGDSGGRVPMLLIGSKVKPGYRSVTLYHHEDTLAMTLEALSIDHSSFPGAAKNAKSMAEFFVGNP
jgi:hypothetical protein